MPNSLFSIRSYALCSMDIYDSTSLRMMLVELVLQDTKEEATTIVTISEILCIKNYRFNTLWIAKCQIAY